MTIIESESELRVYHNLEEPRRRIDFTKRRLTFGVSLWRPNEAAAARCSSTGRRPDHSQLQEQSTMAKAIIYADSASPLDPNLSLTRPPLALLRARVSLVVRLGAAG